MSQLRRYLPFAALIAVQLIVILVAPSLPASSAGPSLGGQFQGGASSTTGGAAAGGGAAVAGSGAKTGKFGGGAAGSGGGIAGTGSTGASGGSAGSGGSGATGGAGGSGGSGGSQGVNGVTGQQVCLKGIIEHPPCVNAWNGGSNGGATSQGVTATSVTVVMYRPAENQAVDAITKATGTYISPAAEQQMLGVLQKWVNSHFQLYGRTIHFVYVHGSCNPAPPNDGCFRNDADSIVAKYHPFAVFWDSDATEAAFFDELAHKGVVSWGGWGFSDSYDDSLRPYHYDVFMGGDVQAELAGEFWCKDLANKPAQYAGGVLKNKTRKVAVVYPQNPQTIPAAKHLESIINHCDHNGAYDAPYSSDTSTAASQATADTTKEKAAGVTSVIWFSDPIAPAYGTSSQASQGWYPEEILAGGQLLDYDALAQTYNSGEWRHAFGLSDLANPEPISKVDAGLIWKQEHESGSPSSSANLMTEYALSLVGGISYAGPKLTPLSYEYGLLTAPGYDSWQQWHDPALSYIKYGKGDYTGQSDVREVYWDPNRTSPINGKRGTYIALKGGARYQPGQIPSGSLALPASQ